MKRFAILSMTPMQHLRFFRCCSLCATRNRPEAEAEALFALARAKAVTQDEISRLTGLWNRSDEEDLAVI